MSRRGLAGRGRGPHHRVMPTKILSRRKSPLSFIPPRFLPEKLRKTRPLVPVLRLYGPIGMSFPTRGALTLAGLAGQIEAAFEAEDACAVALLVKSPGGAAAQSHLIFRRIRTLAEETRRPVFAFIEDVGASGGYMLACAADEIFADPASMVGSIGVVSSGFGLAGLIEKIGVERRVYTAGSSKAMLDPFLPEREDDIARLKALQADVHDSFIALVRERRGARLVETAEDLFTGAYWTGRRARELGLIDGLDDMRSVMRARFGEEVDLRLVPDPSRGGLLRRLLPSLAAGAGAHGDAPQGLVDPGHVIGALEAKALWSRFGL